MSSNSDLNSSESKLILNSFTEFVIQHSLIDRSEPEQHIDEIIGAYIVNAIKQFYEEYENHKIWLGEFDITRKELVENFDIENFTEIMDAYLTGFSTLDPSEIVSWLVELKNEIDRQTECSRKAECLSKVNEKESEQPAESNRRSKIELLLENDEYLKLLVDMFPELELKEINKVYKKCNRNYERAIDELLLREHVVGASDFELTEEEKRELKEKTVQKFGLVAVKLSEDGKTVEPTKPSFKWNEEKKLVRYYENKVVSTKGEKTFEYKTEEDEELAKKMKSTFINLKPARKYRFH